MSIDVKKLLAEAQLPKRIVWVCTRGDLTAEAQRLEAQLQEVEAGSSNRRIVGPNASVEVAHQLADLREQMKAASIEFELTAFSSHLWRAMKADHPVTDKPTQADIVVGADTKSLFNDAVPQAVTAPPLDDDDWKQLVDVLPDGEWQALCNAVYVLNEEGTQLPFSSRAYAVLRAQSDDSESPEASESPQES
jgi:hypothetical protein